jgi:hypothetical protein
MATVLQTPTAALTFRERQDLIERNDRAYRVTVDIQELPSSGHVAFQALADRVLVTATDMDVIAEWLYVMGEPGTKPITKVDLPSGQTVWTLRTRTWSDSPRFPSVPVFVSVVQASDVPVMHEIAEAVRAA